ncbi:MAG TPA: fibronectin type III domain-containing protein, partial [Phnomibacter sp.]|nr:fibronectin type III domain-containing protein [Phnomibacter sp.]
ADRDSIGLLEYRINWSNPSLSTLVNLSSLQAADFKSQICTASRGACVPQPGTTTRLEALQQRVMNQPIYRNFGNREGIVFSHVLDKGSNITAIRWYEMQKTTGTWSILQQSTYGPDNVHRWMPSIAYDAAGNIGLAFNVSDGSTVFPGVRYTGRRSCDPLNTMTYAEAIIIAGTSRNASSRYGDYNHLVADPDGNSFWFTAEWNAGTTWSTRVANFALDNCSTPACDAPGSLASSNITAASATLSWAAVSGAASYTVEYKASTATTWLVAASATTSTSINLTGLSASTIYNWRVRTNCSNNSSGFTDAQFTTAAAPCNAPGSLAGSNITATSATLSWAAVSGAASY